MQRNTTHNQHTYAVENVDAQMYIVPADLRANLHNGFDALIEKIDSLEARVLKLEREQATEHKIIDFYQRRPSWTVKQLAADLSMNEQTVYNFLALPDGHPQKLYSFQANPGGAHHLLPEHVADWLRRNQDRAA